MGPFFLPQAGSNTTILVGNGALSNLTSPFIWSKDPNASLVYILCIGLGGNGAIAPSGTAGGGGGGSGGLTGVLLPSIFVPNNLYCFLGVNGSTRTIVSTTYDLAYTDEYLCVAENGGNASGSSAGAAGSAINQLSGIPRGTSGLVRILSGAAGTAGGATGVAGTNVSGSAFLTGGAGAGGSGANGGTVIDSVRYPAFNSLGGTISSPNGGHGISWLNNYFKPTGGAGGYGGTGLGGNGGIGCGGGGSGSITAGTAGLGGPAMIMISQW